MFLAKQLERLASNRDESPELSTAFLRFSEVTQELCALMRTQVRPLPEGRSGRRGRRREGREGRGDGGRLVGAMAASGLKWARPKQTSSEIDVTRSVTVG